MNIKNHARKVAISALAIGVLASVGIATAGSAFADDGMGVPDPSNASAPGFIPGTQPVLPPYYAPTTQYYVGPDGYWYPVTQPYYSNYNTNPYYYMNPYYNTNPYYNGYVYPTYPVYPVYPTYTTTTYSSTNQLFIQGTIETLGIQPSILSNDLAQGMSLAQVAAQFNFSRDYFLGILVPRVQSDIVNGMSNGTIDSATGNALLGNLINTAGNVVDTPYLS